MESLRPFALLLVLLSLAACPLRSQGQERPNILLLLSDDQAWTDYGFMDHPQIRTPHLDELARQSVVFRRGYVPTALCRPSLMTLITGRYAHQHGVTGNDPSPQLAPPRSAEGQALRASLIAKIDQWDTLPELLAQKGYVSFQAGKWWEGNFRRGGFTEGMTRGFPEPGGRHGDDGLKIGREGLEPVKQFMTRAAEQQQPFFVWYAPFLPHSPHTPPESLLQHYQTLDLPPTVARYYAMCEWMDQTCGELLEHLDQLNVRDNTIVVYVCDNGWIQDPESRGYAPRSKQTAYEGGIRTPILFHWPGHWKPADRPELCSSIDIMPTLLAAADQAAPQGLPGLNLLPTLQNGAAVERERIFGEGFAHDVADLNDPEATLLYRWCIEGRWKLLLTYDGQVNRYKSTHPRTEKRPQLFDLEADPGENQNLAAAHPEIVERLADQIEAWYPVHRRKTIRVFTPDAPNANR